MSSAERSLRRRAEVRRRSRRPRLGRVLMLTAALSLVMPVISWVSYQFGQSGIPVSVATVEWMRDNGARGIVVHIEDWYYTLTAPSKGGPPLKRLPEQAGAVVAGQTVRKAATRHASVPAYYEPPPLKPLIHPALPGEGVWRAPFHERGVKYSPVLITSYRSNPSYPQMVAGVAWIDHTQVDIQYYPGSEEPAVNIPNRGPEEVPPNLRYKLLATFNSGFKIADSGGGVVVNGVTYAPMVDGKATFVKYRNGRMNVISWTYGPKAPHDVLWARQNLPLIVNNGKPNPNLSDGPQWGFTLGNAIEVWRSGLGIDKYGNLIYAAADYQTVASLAQILIHAGAVRAMQLDINAEWPSFITYTGPGAADPANLLSGMSQSPNRYLTPDIRDFYAVYLKSKP
ncbi:MAG: phosphodiester glycosidase family protein [Solirubrobacteraceae bacterium]